MLDQMKIAGALAALMKNKDKFREAGEKIKAHLAELSIEGEAGGGAVRVIANGKMEVLSVKLDPALAAGIASDPENSEMAEALIAEAVNDAMANARSAAHEQVKREAAELGLPDIPGMDNLLGG